MKSSLIVLVLLFAVPAFADPGDDYKIRIQQEEQRRRIEEFQHKQIEQERQTDEQNRRLEIIRRHTPPSQRSLGGSLGRGLGPPA